jgi:hypothetical protein
MPAVSDFRVFSPRNAFVSEDGSISQARLDVFSRQGWVTGHDLALRKTSGQVIQHHRHRDASARHTSPSLADTRVNGDSLFPVHAVTIGRASLKDKTDETGMTGVNE